MSQDDALWMHKPYKERAKTTSLEMVIMWLEARFGRLPTEEEVLEFINGDEKRRLEIWNQH